MPRKKKAKKALSSKAKPKAKAKAVPKKKKAAQKKELVSFDRLNYLFLSLDLYLLEK